jgi:3-methylfumaryl-CoA hydratase
MSTPAVADLERVEPGQELPVRVFATDTIQQFQYNAVLWNAHRIHYDDPYAREVEGYPALVMAGPLLGDWLHQCVVEWLGDHGRLLAMEYSNRRAAYVGDTLRSTGKVVGVDRERGEVSIEVAILNQNDEVLAPGRAVVSLSGSR